MAILLVRSYEFRISNDLGDLDHKQNRYLVGSQILLVRSVGLQILLIKSVGSQILLMRPLGSFEKSNQVCCSSLVILVTKKNFLGKNGNLNLILSFNHLRLCSPNRFQVLSSCISPTKASLVCQVEFWLRQVMSLGCYFSILDSGFSLPLLLSVLFSPNL